MLLCLSVVGVFGGVLKVAVGCSRVESLTGSSSSSSWPRSYSHHLDLSLSADSLRNVKLRMSL